MTKSDLITIIADKLKFPWARAELLVEQIFSCMSDSLMRGEGIEIRGFGSSQCASTAPTMAATRALAQSFPSSPSVWPSSRWARKCASE